MFIDIHVNPAFYLPINESGDRIEFRRQVLGIYHNAIPSLEHVFNQMACAGLDKLCLLAQDNRTVDGDILITNQELRLLVDQAPDKFIGMAGIDPRAPNALKELEYAFTELDLRGLVLHPAKLALYPEDPVFSPFYDLCEKYNRPILFHSGFSWEPGVLAKYSRPIEFEGLAAKRPKLRFCLARFGWPWVQETAMILLKYPNVYADTGVLYFDSAREFYRRIFTVDLSITWIDRSLRHQVMFGSSNPRFEQIRMAEALSTLGLRDSTLELIRGANALEFLEGPR
jgi:predicted TIM-barrel fold metal-dependent hydrolase